MAPRGDAAATKTVFVPGIPKTPTWDCGSCGDTGKGQWGSRPCCRLCGRLPPKAVRERQAAGQSSAGASRPPSGLRGRGRDDRSFAQVARDAGKGKEKELQQENARLKKRLDALEKQPKGEADDLQADAAVNVAEPDTDAERAELTETLRTLQKRHDELKKLAEDAGESQRALWTGLLANQATQVQTARDKLHAAVPTEKRILGLAQSIERRVKALEKLAEDEQELQRQAAALKEQQDAKRQDILTKQDELAKARADLDALRKSQLPPHSSPLLAVPVQAQVIDLEAAKRTLSAKLKELGLDGEPADAVVLAAAAAFKAGPAGGPGADADGQHEMEIGGTDEEVQVQLQQAYDAISALFHGDGGAGPAGATAEPPAALGPGAASSGSSGLKRSGKAIDPVLARAAATKLSAALAKKPRRAAAGGPRL